MVYRGVDWSRQRLLKAGTAISSNIVPRRRIGSGPTPTGLATAAAVPYPARDSVSTTVPVHSAAARAASRSAISFLVSGNKCLPYSILSSSGSKPRIRNVVTPMS
jgi:hypothetical protein